LPNIFKAFSRAKAEPYQFPDAEELVVAGAEPEEEQPPAPEDAPPLEEAEEETGFDVLVTDGDPEDEAEPDVEPEPEVKETPISFAQIQAEQILADARREADQLLTQTKAEADREAEAVFAKAREEGYQEGYVAGMAQAGEESRQLREEQAKKLEEEVHRFMEHAGESLDRQMDQCVPDLRDLAMAVAEKVVCVSLKSSADVISRMIQTAIDKRKKKEWVHIYIAECDAKRLSQMPASLSNALTALSDRVRIIPMADDESGTCIIEMPDEIVDASAATQLNNLRTILTDTANSATGMNLF
jgi:flagellar assembly protein FliH